MSRARRRSWAQRLLLLSGVVVVLGALVSAGAVGYIGYRWSQVTKYDVELRAAPAGEPANYLVVGSDSRENIVSDDPDAGAFLDDGPISGARSDTIMLVRVDPGDAVAAVLSFPRDLWLELADGTGRNRLNAAYGRGRQVLIDTIEREFELTINHYVEIDFVAFREIVDEVGGVALWFEHPVRDFQTGLLVDTPGCHRLDGSQALNFARARMLQYEVEPGQWVSDPTADLGRMTRQQIFLRQALSKALADGFTNPARLNRILGSVLPKLGVDKGLDAGAVLDLARRFRSFEVDDLATYTLPTSRHRTRGGADVELLREREAEPILNVFRGLPPGALRPMFVEVEVLNGTGIEAQASDVAVALGRIGFEVVGAGDHDEHVGRTTVLHAPGGLEAARRVAQHISGGAALVEDASIDSAHRVVLVTGDDLTTLHDQPSPAGSHDDLLTTTVAPVAGEGDARDEGDERAEPPEEGATTTTTVVGYATGDPPPGELCR